MKFATIVAAAAYATVANAASCDVASLQTLLTNSDTTTCASDSGYTVTSLATPTAAELAVMCTSTACQSVLSQLQQLAPSECTLGTFSLYADLITPLTEYCAGSTGSTAAGSSAATVTVGSTAGSTATAPTVGSTNSSSTGSVAATTSTTSSGSSTTETTSSASAAASASASASASSSGASMAAVSAGAVLAAVAATFF